MSFHKSLVIVVGAGASNEVGLPLGSELKRSISNGLNFIFRGSERLRGGSDLIMSAIEYLSYDQPGAMGDFNKYFLACRTIFEAIPQALSIDNLVDAHRGGSTGRNLRQNGYSGRDIKCGTWKQTLYEAKC
jgi:hypothetical protein